MDNSADPAAPATSILPETSNPFFSGVPSRPMTTGLALAVSKASRAGSELPMIVNTQ
ncbi:MAG TPA: hypothetical protein VFB04_13025 [Terriglobales bacterium]|nr:hypothetical protein [Terriglobales bacterium]